MTKIMGILNVTPDSFSDGGNYVDLEQAVRHAKQLVADGADAIDVGGESTRPGAVFVSAAEEIERVVPVIRRLKRELDVLVSIDTYKPDVAEAAVRAGADIINDVWGSKWGDCSMVNVAAHYDVPIILMHNRLEPHGPDMLAEVRADLEDSIRLAKQAGVSENQIWLDPGIGFMKTHQENLFLMRHLSITTDFGYPVLLGTSRKSMIGLTLGLPADQRVEGTIATVCYGIQQGCEWMRVHDVKAVKRAAVMMDAMLETELTGGE
ncbi:MULTISPECIES: dihydropteroate synthase [Exiguobacterium]|uniref:Dihydropteroate synthase n=1 Tax=Exiguobacterium sibiricum (strain DSM 17290 / CCUG 55495 / CIP 109462 / JCM 13490 / 255-15) TaxID=262543 RepID=B1YGR4_EXIS2|nr:MULTISPECIES: dihydropteroate synthase [Exiguobacterium]ACB59547.1 dihydropteroate synthase [Exiguobacterium sibiricum 255-15]MCT4792408.1 dihydropteroate synthase [Exiguobacterium artemiae]